MLIRWLIYAVVAGLIVSALAMAWHVGVAEPYRAQGRTETTKKLQPQIDQLAAALKTAQANNATLRDNAAKLQAALDETNARWAARSTADAAAQAQAHDALANARAALQTQTAKLAELTRIANAPRETDDALACRDARGILDDLARERLREPAAQ